MAAVSIFDIFKIGIGPSSSHTVGPMKAARAFAIQLDAISADIACIEVTLHGSLAYTGRGHGTDAAVVLGLAGLFVALVLLSKLMRTVVAAASESAMRRILEMNIYLAMVIGAALTVAVQSSSITTSLMVPLVGTGILRLETVYPLVLGANMGTTVTALLASLVGNVAAISIALTHLCFNLAGTALFLPVPFMRWPIGMARRFAGWAADHRTLALAAVFFVFYGIPGILIFLTR